MQLSSVKAALRGVGCELGFVGDSLEFVGQYKVSRVSLQRVCC